MLTTRDINTIVRADGSELQVQDIMTAAEGQVLLDEIDSAIIIIEVQIRDAREGLREDDPDWRRRAEIALKLKRRSRPRLQQRIGELRKAERIVRPPPEGTTSPKDGQRKAFIVAAVEVLGDDMITKIWARAREMRPHAFPEAL